MLHFEWIISRTTPEDFTRWLIDEINAYPPLSYAQAGGLDIVLHDPEHPGQAQFMYWHSQGQQVLFAEVRGDSLNAVQVIGDCEDNALDVYFDYLLQRARIRFEEVRPTPAQPAPPTEPAQPKRCPWTQDEMEQVKSLWQRSMTDKEIAKAMSISARTVFRIREVLGLVNKR